MTSDAKLRGRSGGHNDYFSKLNTLLKKDGSGHPVIVLDLDILDQNLQELNSNLADPDRFRVVVKSLPSIDLIRYIFEQTKTRKAMVFHRPFLNLLAEDPLKRDDWVLTPHPGEAARLLGSSSGAIQSDRFQAVQGIRERFGGAALLKGAGSLVAADPARPVAVISEGNPGMASGGVGDVLTGIVGTFLAQGFSPEESAVMGGSLHAAAGDLASRAGERGMLASDLFSAIRRLLAGEGAPC